MFTKEQKKFLRIYGAIIAGIVAILVLSVGTMVWRFRPKTIMTKRSPKGLHTAKLQRAAFIDLNYIVYIDGTRVWGSPDFSPVDLDFREQIMWDRKGEVLVLEVAGERIFGWDATNKRELSAADLQRVEFPAFVEYRYEGKLPTGTAESNWPATTPFK